MKTPPFILSPEPQVGSRGKHLCFFALFYNDKTVKLKHYTFTKEQAESPELRASFTEKILSQPWGKGRLLGVSCITKINLISWLMKAQERWTIV